MSNNKKNPPYMELCLCHRCASVYFDDPSYYIEAKEAYQVIKETCDICQQYKGKDYRIWKNENMRFRETHTNGGGQK